MLSKSTQQKIARALSREPRIHNRVFEMRAIIDGIPLYACSSDEETCRDLFFQEIVEKLLHVDGADLGKRVKAKRNILFVDFANKWFEEIHAKKVIPDTYSKDLSVYKRHIVPFFAKMALVDITAADCMRFAMKMKEKKIDRTAEQCDMLIRQIFDYAEAEEIIARNPLGKMKRVKATRENGVPLTKSEERDFVRSISGTKYEAVFLLMLYSGLRPCEISSVQIEELFIVSRNRKQKNGKIAYKKIPITPMMRRHLDVVEGAIPMLPTLVKSEHYLNEVFRKYCADHKLYDLRTTFATRTQECKVPENVVQFWMGHSARTLLGRVYTKFSDEYLLEESAKVVY